MRNPMVDDRRSPTGSELAATLREVAAQLDGLGDVPLTPDVVVQHLREEIARRGREGSRSS